MLFSFVADHFQYLASLGLVSAFAAGLNILWSRRPAAHPWLSWAVSSLLVAGLGFLTWQQGTIYRNPESLWLDVVSKNPACWMAYENLGVYYARQGKLDDAIFQYRHALRLRPDEAGIHHDFGTALARQGRYSEAQEQFHAALRLQPRFYEAEYNLGLTSISLRNYAEAAQHLQAALQIKGDEPEGRHLLAQAWVNLGEYPLAVQQYREALRLRPDWPEAANDLAWLLATAPMEGVRNGAEALRLATRVCELTSYNETNYLDTLAAAFAEAGDFSEAARIGKMALESARTSGLDASILEAYQNRLNLYLQHIPYREQRSGSR